MKMGRKRGWLPATPASPPSLLFPHTSYISQTIRPFQSTSARLAGRPYDLSDFIAFERGALTTTANRGFVEHFFEQAAWYRTEVNFTQSGKSMYKSYLNFRINKTKPSVAGAAHELSTAPLIKFIQGDRAARKSKVDSGWWWVA